MASSRHIPKKMHVSSDSFCCCKRKCAHVKIYVCVVLHSQLVWGIGKRKREHVRKGVAGNRFAKQTRTETGVLALTNFSSCWRPSNLPPASGLCFFLLLPQGYPPTMISFNSALDVTHFSGLIDGFGKLAQLRMMVKTAPTFLRRPGTVDRETRAGFLYLNCIPYVTFISFDQVFSSSD